MARLGDTYRGLWMPLWRRLALRYSGFTAVALAIICICLFVGALFAGWHPPGWSVYATALPIALLLTASTWVVP